MEATAPPFLGRESSLSRLLHTLGTVGTVWWHLVKTRLEGVPGWLRCRASAFSGGHDPEVLGSSPTSDSVESLFLPVCLCLSQMVF